MRQVQRLSLRTRGAAPRVVEHVERVVDHVVAWLVSRRGDTMVVTNEVGDGVVPAYARGRVFRDVLGRANRALVDGADAAYLCVAAARGPARGTDRGDMACRLTIEGVR